jgi:hypothetical protein
MHIQFDRGGGWHRNVVIGGLTSEDGVEIISTKLHQPQLIRHTATGLIHFLTGII